MLRLSGWFYLPGRRVDAVLYPAAASLLGWFAVEWSKHAGFHDAVFGDEPGSTQPGLVPDFGFAPR